MLLPVLTLILLGCLWALSVVGQQLRCVDAARTAARALARGEPEALARAAALAAAPDGAVVRLQRRGELVTVEVRLVARPPGPWGGRGPGVAVASRAVTAVE